MYTELYKQEGENLICLNHKENVNKVGKSKNMPLNQILWCKKCYAEQQSNQRDGLMIFDHLKDLIYQQYDKTNKDLKQQKEDLIKNLKEFQGGVSILINKLKEQLEQFWEIIENFCQDIQKTGQSPEFISLLLEIEKAQENDFKFKKTIDILKDVKKQHLKIVKQIFIDMNVTLQDFPNCLKEFLNLLDKTSEWEKIQQQLNAQPVGCKQKQQSILQKNECGALKFMKQNLIAGCDNKIKIWLLQEGEMKEIKVLEGHRKKVNCIAISQKHQWFASGDIDGSIITWKQQEDQNWKQGVLQKIDKKKKHTSFINSLILNKKEDQLFSCSGDNYIKIWKVDYLTNEIEYSYNLHCTYPTLAMSLNQSEKYLVSCHSKSFILLWPFDVKANEFSIYTKKEKRFQKPGSRICFINEIYFVLQEEESKFLSVYSIAGFEFELVKNIDLQFVCSQNNKSPTFVHKKRKIVVHQSGKQLHLIKILNNDILGQKIEIDLEEEDCYFQLSDIDDYLVVWGALKQQFRIYQIEFDQKAIK